MSFREPTEFRIPFTGIVIGVAALAAVILAFNCYTSVPAGHVAVATLFGNVRDAPYEEGFHFPVNPLYHWHLYDARQKSHKEQAAVPSQDQLQTSVEVSVQWRIISSMAPNILQETGSAEDTLIVHLIPKVRSILREQGKSIKRAEDFFLEETQAHLETALLAGLREYLAPKGINVDAVLIRDITLPDFIRKAIESKKEREQSVERQRAELERFRLEQEQSVAVAEAQRRAAEEQAQTQRVLADAQAYEIEAVRKAMGDDPGYLQLQALGALKTISKDPAAKIYFLNGDSPSPLPLMHMGER